MTNREIKKLLKLLKARKITLTEYAQLLRKTDVEVDAYLHRIRLERCWKELKPLESKMNTYTVKFTAERRSDGAPYERIVEVCALTRIEAEDAALRKCRMLGYRNYAVEVISGVSEVGRNLRTWKDA